MIRKEIGLKEIERDIENLTPQEQLKLMEKIAYLLRKSIDSGKQEVNWSRIYGLGKGLWADEDAQDYVNKLRQER
jgi:hypothetical protein